MKMQKAGRSPNLAERQAIQYAADLIYRFPADTENFWIGCGTIR